MTTTRNIYAVILSGLVLFMTTIGLLGIWEVIEWQDFMKYFWKSLYSLIILFVSGAVILFIYSTIYKIEKKPVSPPLNDIV